ncbi:hypothetical protein [Xanthomonas maliensis]|uniref:hypothetical protein n=1 Tax=Xanthomonas maliensis TaxID=1321368 RepID=UPI0012646A09|nr:hypothetical protein [Xanthomonas maliensis]KAB7762470.1 hypothetical protein CKY51_21180 [Xanthomonas maliensis]
MTDIVVFHAGQEQMSSFRPCVHVGDREAALGRVRDTGGYLHTCSLKVTDQLIEVEDWGANTGAALFCALNDYFEKGGRILDQGFFDGARALINHAQLSREVQESFLVGQLRVRGISVICYRNKVENAGSTSYFVLDPDLLTVKGVVRI